jgi:signal transduction histidine kinase
VKLRRPRPTVRLRLTLLYAGLFVLCGAALLSVDLGLLADSAGRSVSVAAPAGASTSDLTARKLLPDETRAGLVAQLRRLSLASFAAMVAVSFGVGWLIAGRVLRPVRAITAAARRASEHNLRERVRLRGPDGELKELADTLDDLLASLDAAYDVQRRFAANASHELRTPLSIVRTSIEVALASPRADLERYRRMALEARDAVRRAERLIDGLMLLSGSEQETPSPQPVDLAAAARDALLVGAAELEARGLRLTTALEPAPVTGVPSLLERMVGNLVENAIRHNVAGGAIEVATGVARRQAFVHVRNDGAWIPADVLPRLFEPFRRLDADRTGSTRGAGLGLSIVESVAARHAGAVDARPRAGGGMEVMVTVPAAP